MSEPSARKLPGHIRALTKTSIASLIATGVEFVLLAVLVHRLKLEHWVSYASVQFVANAISFLLYKYWAFESAHHGSMRTQYLKQGVIFLGSLFLNTNIASFFSYKMHLEPVLAFAMSNLIVYFGWNYPGNRYFVFRRRHTPTP